MLSSSNLSDRIGDVQSHYIAFAQHAKIDQF